MAVLNPGGPGAAHQTLLFHRVLAEPDELRPSEPTREWFARLVAHLARHFHILPLYEAIERLKAGDLPPASLSITFDDGYADNATIAAPILADHGVQATFFVATGFLDGGRMWNDTLIEAVRRMPPGTLNLGISGIDPIRVSSSDRETAVGAVISSVKHLPHSERAKVVSEVAAGCECLPDDLMMTSAQVKALSDAGMEVGGHTDNHPILARLPSAVAREEILAGKRKLEQVTGQKVRLFAYPNGKPGQDYGPEHVDMVREAGFSAAVSTQPGVARSAVDLFQWPRFTPWDRSPGRFVARLMMNRWGLMR